MQFLHFEQLDQCIEHPCYTKVYQKVPGLAPLTKKYIPYLSLNTISFEIVALCSNAPVTAILPLLECGLEVILCKRVHNLLQFALDLGNGVKTATFQLHLYLPEKEEVGRS
jgi:hypothetical protein